MDPNKQAVPQTETPPDNLFRCGCCEELHSTAEAQADTDLQCAVCGDCLVQLRWAQARMKSAGIVGCARRFAPGSNG